MAEPIVVVESLRDWKAPAPSVRLVLADDYLADPAFAESELHVINLCRSTRYQSLGYYCSLLAEARVVRNDLIHALPDKHGLHRRTSKDLSYVRNFYTAASLRKARVLFEQALRNGNKVLYSDGGAAVKRWYGDARQ